MDSSLKVLVTGERELSQYPTHEGETQLVWQNLPVLRYERLAVDQSVIQRVVDAPFDWILFTSPRSVEFWSELCLEHQIHFPIVTQVACIGEETANRAGLDGFTADFYPIEPGTEGFLEEFAEMISNNPKRPSILIPMAKEGRKTLGERLAEMGCEVVSVPLYQTLQRDDISEALTKENLDQFSVIVFTSPSSVDAFRKFFAVPEGARIACLGTFTSEHLSELKIAHKILPEGRLENIGAIL